jgi:hypothetical protein
MMFGLRTLRKAASGTEDQALLRLGARLEWMRQDVSHVGKEHRAEPDHPELGLVRVIAVGRGVELNNFAKYTCVGISQRNGAVTFVVWDHDNMLPPSIMNVRHFLHLQEAIDASQRDVIERINRGAIPFGPGGDPFISRESFIQALHERAAGHTVL